MTNHTPGPWKLNGFHSADETCGIMSGTINERGHHVNSEQVLPFFDCDPQGMHYQRHMADKRLIEAAPDMFNTLHDILIKADRQRIQLGALLCIHPETSAIRTAMTENALILNAARAAISKATTPE